ncbi:MAG: hypothetical protein CMM46_12380 [Rhodospirillaceae bacterium]|nr:hypothetical protein [Rhodospirillaceae bacterium]|tara:strand:+ start:554 stop:1510 length:957 start_codon:yes stop_codon:yes gene_type:complete
MGLPSSTTDLHRAENDLFDHGYCIVADALTPEQTTGLHDRLLAQAAAERRDDVAYEFGAVEQVSGTENFTVRADSTTSGPKHQFIGVLVNKGEVFRDIVLHPAADHLATSLLGEDWVLSAHDGSIVRPDGPQQTLHTDQWWMPLPQRRDERQRPPGEIRRGEFYGDDDGDPARLIAPAVSCTSAWTLTPFTDENGATRVVPGSHLSGLQPDPEKSYDNEAVSIEAPAGSFIVWDARTWHGMGKNRTGEERVAINSVYNTPVIRTQINWQAALLPDIRAEASTELLVRLGYKVWGGYYGRVGAADGDMIREADIIGELR